MEQLLTPWVENLNQKRIPLTWHAIAAKARGLFDEYQQNKVEMRHSLLAKDGLQGSSYAQKFIA